MQTTRIKQEKPGTAALLGFDGLVTQFAEGAWWADGGESGHWTEILRLPSKDQAKASQ